MEGDNSASVGRGPGVTTISRQQRTEGRCIDLAEVVGYSGRERFGAWGWDKTMLPPCAIEWAMAGVAQHEEAWASVPHPWVSAWAWSRASRKCMEECTNICGQMCDLGVDSWRVIMLTSLWGWSGPIPFSYASLLCAYQRRWDPHSD